MRVYIRGNPAIKGEWARKGFLQILGTNIKADSKAIADLNRGTDKEREQTAKGVKYSRLDLANDIASNKNPLTARVFVNRIWLQHFGRGLVDTASNFGQLGNRPSHPELLDWLAVRFMESGWSIKKLHREILLSQAYQRSSQPATTVQNANASLDPDNVYLWRMNRRRMEIEVWRDTLLAIAGNLDPKVYGPTFNMADANSNRRTIYAKISRHELNGILRIFDFPDANVTSAKRTVTTVPQQQLFVLNSDFMVNQSKSLAKNVQQARSQIKDQIGYIYELIFSRSPSAQEIEIGTRYLQMPKDPNDRLSRWEQYAQALLATNELMYID